MAYIAQVALDPTRTFEYGVALLPAEVQDIINRQAGAEAAAPLLDAYGEQHPDEFAGWFQDQTQGGALIALFTADLEQHLHGLWQTLEGRTPPIAVQVKSARYTLAELEALQKRIEDDMAAWAARGINIVFVGKSVSLNVVEIGVLGPAPTAEQQLAAAYGADAIVVYINDKSPETG